MILIPAICRPLQPPPSLEWMSHSSLFTFWDKAALVASMKPAQFDQAVARIYQRNPRIDPQAYFFLKDSLDVALKAAEDSRTSDGGHVSAKQLLFAFRDHALNEFGPMAGTLMTEWGLKSTTDIGSMVFALIGERMFGKQESDSEKDFSDIFDFQDAFITPFRPKSTITS